MDRAVCASAEHTSAEYASGSYNMSGAGHFTGIASSYDVHNGVAAIEMLVFFTLHDVEAFMEASAAFHGNIDVGVAFHIGIFAIAAAEHAEVRGPHLIIYLLPLFALEQFLAVVSSRHHLCIIVEKSLDHCKIGVSAYFASLVSTSVDVVVYLELQRTMVILRRVRRSVDDACRFPRAGIHIP